MNATSKNGADCYGMNAQRNARMIAAAPALKSALEQALKWVDCGCDPCDPSQNSLEAARSALALWQGMTPQPTPPAASGARHAGGRPPRDAEAQTAYLHFRITPARKTAYRGAAQARGQTLIGWAFAHLDREAAYQPEGKR